MVPNASENMSELFKKGNEFSSCERTLGVKVSIWVGLYNAGTVGKKKCRAVLVRMIPQVLEKSSQTFSDATNTKQNELYMGKRVVKGVDLSSFGKRGCFWTLDRENKSKS
ncbi:hypothetical protein SCA6_005080 [Theobroma cacao]